jgi:hypothetical protein
MSHQHQSLADVDAVEVGILLGGIGISTAGPTEIDVHLFRGVIRHRTEEGEGGIGIAEDHGEVGGGCPFRGRGRGRLLGERDMIEQVLFCVHRFMFHFSNRIY